MIVFETLRWKNLLSTGNAFIEIQLNSDKTSLISGKNGHGKSTILDALTFVLFGKPFRDVNKPQLVNTINQKDLVVEIEFTISPDKYKVIRGIKPNIFEIHKNGALVNQEAAVRDYQKHLESNILKINYKSFTQVVILGSASFKPFMQLSPADRRQIIENLLDIEIFSTMGALAKEKLSKVKSEIIVTEGKIKTYRELLQSQKKTYTMLQESADDEIENIKKLKQEAIRLEEEEKKKVKELQATYDGIVVPDIKEEEEKYRKLLQMKSKFEAESAKLRNDNMFFHDHDDCPTCRQSIEPDFREDTIKKNEDTIANLKRGIEKAQTQMNECNQAIREAQIVSNEKTKVGNELNTAKVHLSSHAPYMKQLDSELDRLMNRNTLIETQKKEIRATHNTIVESEKERVELNEKLEIYTTAITLFKDGGIKSAIIKQYLPIINKLINKYLSQMDFFVDFNIDETFEETIRSRHRDTFTYHSFSEGQKKRIDLALLFAWREVARARNSANINLLILDEVLDGSLDADGMEEFIRIIKQIADGNTFIISHKTDQIGDKFDRNCIFEMKKNFSTLRIT
jgi:DNA repair exonuclease SbcCD ATPase subunit